MSYYKIQKKDKFFIFGAGLLGRHICDKLLDAGFTVQGFLDNSEFSIPYYRNVEIIPFKKAQNFTDADKKAIVIISLINPFDHNEVKNTLLSAGFSRIICKRNILKYENKYKINNLYDIITSFNRQFSAQMILDAEFEAWEDETEDFQDNSFISSDNDYITAYLPIELLYAVGRPVIMQQQVLSMFECFRGELDGNLELFWQYACKTQSNLPKKEIEKEKNRILDGRLKIYRYMTQALAMDPDFFVRHPVTVVKQNGIFLIKDGMHRTLFLYSHGFRFIPCSMPVEHYKEWLNKGKVFFDDKENVITPILHPFYYFKHSITENMYKTRLDVIFKFLAEQNIYEGQVLDMGHNSGWFGRNLQRAGFSVISLVTESDREYINKINYIEDTNITMLNTFPNDKKFDFIISIDLVDFTDENMDSIKRMSNYATKFIFLEIKDLLMLEALQKKYKILKCSIEAQCNFSKIYLVVIEL